jgi:hypothetical protein
MIASPLPPTATQRWLLGQETPSSPPLKPASARTMLATRVTFQAVVSPLGLLEVTTLPLPPTATHRPLLGQDKLESPLDPFT